MSGADADGVRSLRESLSWEDELRGRVELVEAAPRRGELGVVPDALVVALGPGVVTAVVSVVITWIRHRSYDVDVEMTRADGAKVAVSAKRVRGANSDSLRELVTEAAATLDGVAAEVDGSARRPAEDVDQ
ncbi:effector-associated constant component EACC1 [Actinokineospora iranica]|uniref:effector-associated constant component EACC1 n=1 Tax=Actinokineospora iranica TaxID=1271860 RepID=UPI0011146584|nr:hypothetical protein [Actinokineospora iranica]